MTARGLAFSLALLIGAAAPSAADAQEPPPSMSADAEAGPAAEESLEEEGGGGGPESNPETEPTGSQPGGEAGEPASDALKLAVVVVGDPDPALVEAARAIEEVAAETLRLPVDVALREALQGAQGTDGDGLDAVRSARRRLAMAEDESEDLGRLADASNAAYVLTLRMMQRRIVLGAYRAGAAARVESTLVLPAPSAAISGWLAALPHAPLASEPVPPPPSEAEAIEEPDVSPEAVAQAASESEGEAAEEEPGWFEENWPLLVGGALVIGVLVWFLIPQDDEVMPPTLRFVPGGG